MRRFKILSLLAIVGCLLAADVVQAQPGGRGRGGFGGGGTSLDLLRSEEVRKELEVSDDQWDEINALADEMGQEQRDYFMGLREKMQGLSDEERREMFGQLQKDVGELRTRYDDMANEKLLPVQIDRLKQLVVQRQAARNGGLEGGTLPEALIEAAGVTEEQLEELKEKAKEVMEDLRVKVAKLKASAAKEVLSVLDADQVAKIEEMMGESFTFQQNQQRGGWGGGGDRGRGGDRGEGGGRGGDRGEGGGRGGDRGGRGGGGDRGGRGGGGERGQDF
jgi:hypothetical protein